MVQPTRKRAADRCDKDGWGAEASPYWMRLGRAESSPLVTLVDFALSSSRPLVEQTSNLTPAAARHLSHNQYRHFSLSTQPIIHTHLKSHKLPADPKEYPLRHYLEYELHKTSVLPQAIETTLNIAPQTA